MQVGGGTYLFPLGTSLFVFKDDKQAHSTSWTLDQLFTRRFGVLNLSVEGAIQEGALPGKKLEAWATVLRASLQIAPRITTWGQYDSASGGSNATKSFGFDQLYPSGHNLYGVADMQGLRNMNTLDCGLSWKPSDKSSLMARYLRFELRDASDGWYSTAGSINKFGSTLYVDSSGGKGREVGDEFDLVADRKLTTTQSVGAGLSILRPRNFMKSFNPGASEDQLFGYIYYTLKI